MIYALIIVIFLILVYYFMILPNIYNKTIINGKAVCNDIDKRCYRVSEQYRERLQASETLAILNKFCINFMRKLREKYLFNPSDEKRAAMIRYLLSNYNPESIIENVPLDDKNTSYVEEKGKVFGICLRERITKENNFQDLPTIKFVLIHELTHMSCFSYGHGEEFWRKFKTLLRDAVDWGMIEVVDYANKPANYCSLLINYNPLLDNKIQVW